MPSPRVSLTESLVVRPTKPPTNQQDDGKAYFASQSLWTPCGARGVFGGQVIGQALQAGSMTITGGLGLHSQHCYFLLPADASLPIVYAVEKLRDGKSYSTRLVKALQKGRPVFILLASYTLPPISLPPSSSPSDLSSSASATKAKSAGSTPISHSLRFALTPSPSCAASALQSADPRGITSLNDRTDLSYSPVFQIPYPEDVLPWKECVPEEIRWRKFLAERGEEYDGKRRAAVEDYIKEREESPMCIAVTRRVGSTPEEERNKRLIWLKAKLGPNESLDEETIRAMFAYMTDFQFIGTAARSVGLTRTSTPRLGMLASLDHTTHFYPLPANFDPSSPLLHIMDSPLTHVASGRGVVRGLLYTAEGILVATTLQEGVVRADLGKGERGVVEGGGVGDEDDVGKRKAKL